MFGDRFFGPRYFGNRFFGPVAQTLPPDYYTPRNPTVSFPPAVSPTTAFPAAVTPTVSFEP